MELQLKYPREPAGKSTSVVDSINAGFSVGPKTMRNDDVTMSKHPAISQTFKKDNAEQYHLIVRRKGDAPCPI